VLPADGRREVPDGAERGEVRPEELGRAPLVRHLADDLAPGLRVAAVDEDGRPAGAEPPGRAAADAARRPGEEVGPPGEVGQVEVRVRPRDGEGKTVQGRDGRTAGGVPSDRSGHPSNRFGTAFMGRACVGFSMVSEGDTAPTFTATVANGDVEPFDLEDHLGDGPVVLAFFPGAFTPSCSNEMVALQERHDEFVDAGATLLGVSADSAFSGNAFREEHGIEFDLVSDMARKAIGTYGLEIDIDELGLHGVANRAVYVIDEGGTVAYEWVADDPANEPDYEEMLAAVGATPV